MSDLRLSAIDLRFGGLQVLRGIELTIEASGITALIGPNGAGKTSLVNVITGTYTPTSGTLDWAGQPLTGILPHDLPRLGIARTFQNLEIFWTMSVLDNVMTAAQTVSPARLLPSLLKTPAVHRAEGRFRALAFAALERAGLVDYAEREAGDLSYGHLKRLEIARALALDPRLLLLDEPYEGLAPVIVQEIERIVAQIKELGITTIIVEQNAIAALELANRALILDMGQIVYDGTAKSVLDNAELRNEYLAI